MGFHGSNIAPLEQKEKTPGDGRKSDDQEVARSSSISRRRNHKLCSRGHWRTHEDAKLKELVAQFGPQNWNLIAQKLEGRSGKSCRLRWFNQLDPRIEKRPFSEEEEERLVAAHRMYGKKWAMISKLFPGRTDNGVKNHWHVMVARKRRGENSVGYRGRKPSNFKAYYYKKKGIFWENTQQNTRGCNESNMSSNNADESASTCTNLSLTPPTERYNCVGFLSSFASSSGAEKGKQMKARSAVDFHWLSSNRGLAREAAVLNPRGESDADAQSHGSGSEVSASSESVASDVRANAELRGLINAIIIEKGTDEEAMKSSSSFIDFLGVGTTS